MRIKGRGGLGDEFAMTALVREAKKFMPREMIRVVQPRYPEVWENNPNIGHGELENGKLIQLQLMMNEAHGNISNSFGLQAGVPMENTMPELFLTEDEKNLALHRLDGLKRPLIGIDTGANWPSRRWMGNRWVELANRVSRWATVIEVGVPGGDHYGWQKHTDLENSVKLMTLPIRESAAILSECDLYVGNDSGCFHMAASVGTPQVILCGVKGEKVVGYPGTICVEGSKPCDVACSEMCKRKRADYQPVSKERWQKLNPREQEDEGKRMYHFCMEDIQIDHVEQKIREAINGRDRSERHRDGVHGCK